MNQSGTIQEFIRREVLSIIERSRRCGYSLLYLIDDLSACARRYLTSREAVQILFCGVGYDGRIFKSYAAFAEV